MKNEDVLGIVAGVLLLLGLVTGSHGSVGWTSITIIASLVAFLVKFGLALAIYLRNPSGKVNRYFAIVFTGQAIWDLGKFFMWMSSSESVAHVWALISYSGYIISVFFMFGFVWSYLKKKNFFTSVMGRFILYAVLVLMLAALWFTGTIIHNLVLPEQHSYGYGIELWDYQYGPVYQYFFIWFQILPFLYAFASFVMKYFQTHSPDKKKQLFYLMLGSAFPIAIGIPTGIILPSMGINLPPHNNLLSLIMSVFIAIGIIKYKFLAIQPVGETVVPGRKLEHELAKEYKLDFGHSYYIKHERSSEISHKVLLTHLYNRRYGLILSTHNPAKTRHEYGIETTPIIWITDTETEHLSVDPIDIEQIFNTIKSFVERVHNSFVLIDGIGYLLKHNNFAKILHFVKQVKMVVAENDCCLIMPAGNILLDPKAERLLEAEFTILPKAMKKSQMDGMKIDTRKKAINYIIIGYSPLAESILHEFELKKIKPTIIEKKDVPAQYKKGAVNTIIGDPLSSKVLMGSGITKPNTVVLITLENDSEVILCINKIKQISDSVRVITNIHNKNFIPIAMKAGADKVIPSSAIGGKLISFALNSPEIVRWVMDATTMTSKELELVEVQVRKTAFSGKTIGDIDRLIETYANIISVRTIDGLKQIPDDKYLLKDEDSLVMIVNVSKLPKGKDLSDRIGSLVKKK